MDKHHNKSTQKDYKRHKTDSKNLFVGGLIVLLIAVAPFVFYSYKGLPNDSQVWETPLFTITTSYYSINAYAWFIVGKVVPLYLLLLWFFTCKHWWHWIILVPIAMYSFQLWGIFNQNRNLDELELYYILPLMMFLVPAVYLVRAKLFSNLRKDDLKSFEEELMLKKTAWQQIKDLFR
ncbi:hypothetical protein ATE92_2268 [Ulvibacter sp. MAR_2010_11]|uniref:hypothetical protein n=1 Tax=Ulvibacter sp. MAR_2010_11 TaxID=1250229 RepID=UPI000C2BC5E6|nr:hypothetical protein [Ulvibacter sp. MAR_2010_11]PKA84098.1 hypothetical protein ATE92_2268 [Ulvibacter sp. MAR_2010_11]